MRNNVPAGASVSEFPLAGGVERAGGLGQSLIERLRISVHALERTLASFALPPAIDAGRTPPACSFFSADPLPDRERELPLTELTRGGLHEIKAETYRDSPAAIVFVLAAIAEHLGRTKPAPVLWCLTSHAAHEWGHPYGPGLLALGLDPALFLIVEARTEKDAAWALEEGLKSGALAACLGQIEIETPLFARRLGVAAKAARTPCLLLSGHRGCGLPGTLTRWRVSTAQSEGVAFDANAPGNPSFHLTLERCVGMPPMRSMRVEFCHESHRFRLLAPPSHRAVEAAAEELARAV